MSLEFTATFKNSVGVEVAGTGFDEEHGEWALYRPASKLCDAAGRYRFLPFLLRRGNPLTDRKTSQRRASARLLTKRVCKGEALKAQNQLLLKEIRQLLMTQTG